MLLACTLRAVFPLPCWRQAVQRRGWLHHANDPSFSSDACKQTWRLTGSPLDSWLHSSTQPGVQSLGTGSLPAGSHAFVWHASSIEQARVHACYGHFPPCSAPLACAGARGERPHAAMP